MGRPIGEPDKIFGNAHLQNMATNSETKMAWEERVRKYSTLLLKLRKLHKLLMKDTRKLEIECLNIEYNAVQDHADIF